MKSATLPSFWTAYRSLPESIKKSARKSHRLWEQGIFQDNQPPRLGIGAPLQKGVVEEASVDDSTDPPVAEEMSCNVRICLPVALETHLWLSTHLPRHKTDSTLASAQLIR